MAVTSFEEAGQPSAFAPSECYTFPLSFAQMDMWLASHLAVGSAAYHIADNLVLSGPLRIDVLAKSLNEIVARHETLRTTFAVIDGELLQVVAPEQKYELPMIDLETLAPQERDIEVRRLTKLHACEPFDLAKGPLVRWQLLRIDPDWHVLLCTMHHLITDGWSQSIFLSELIALYDAHALGEEPSLPELTIQYGDFAVWERDALQGERLSSLLDYWKQQLADMPETLTLPVDYAPGEHSASKCASETFKIPEETTRRLIEISRASGVTLFVTLASSLAILLHRLGAQDKLLIGSPMAVRNRVELEKLIGLFLNILLLRFDLSGNPSFQSLLPRIQEMVYGAQEHQGLPLERLASALRAMGKEPSRPFFRVLFNLENTPQQNICQAAGITFEPFGSGADTAKVDLIWHAQETASGLAGSFEYNTDLFEAPTIRQMIGLFCTLLAGIAASPGTPIEDLPMLSESQRRELLIECNPIAVPVPPVAVRPATLPELFEEQVERRPAAVALVWDGQQLTYRELNRRANQLARHLQQLGVGPESLVGICVERSLGTILGLLGILKAGGAYLPLDPGYPPERLRFMVEDAAPMVLLTEERLLEDLPEFERATVCLDRDWPVIARQSEENLPSIGSNENLAYVIYTSGSTGRPKGVMISHRNVVRLFDSTAEEFALSVDDVWTLLHTFSFDFSVWEMWGALLYGGRLVVMPYWVSRSPDAFHQLLCDEQVTILNQTPSAFRQLIEIAVRRGANAGLRLREVIFGGEALELSSLRPWYECYAESPQLVNMYGITETTVHVTYCALDETKLEQRSLIGTGLKDLAVYVLDQRRAPVPKGVAGELYVGGEGLARGYLRRAALTAERFVPNPYSQVGGARIYRTGDGARYRNDGNIEYVGRLDHQVKIRGFRVELGEIENALLGCEGVREAVVVAREDETGAQRLAAYLVGKDQSRLAASELRAQLQTLLPDYMMPTSYTVLDALPLNHNGKVDRKALPAPASGRSASDRVFVEPRNAMEEILASIWSKALNIQKIGVHDNFYSLGGDSIRSLRVAALAKARGLPLSIQQMARYRTIAELAPQIQIGETRVEEEIHTAPFSLISAEDRAKLPEDVEDAYPLAQMQLGMLFHIEMTPGAPVFHTINSYHLRMPWDVEKIQRAVLYVASRHPNLRTSFDLSAYSEPLQLVHRNPGFPIPIYDLRRLTEDEQERELNAFWKEEAKRPFDLTRAPQLRFHIHRRSDDTFEYTLTENHAIVDGWSLHVMWDEILTTYFAFLNGEEPELPPLKTTYRDFIASERSASQSQQSKAFWDSKLRGYSGTRLPRLPDHRPDLNQPRVKRKDRLLPRSLVGRLRKLAREEAVPLKSVFLAAHVKVLSILTASRDVVTGLSCNGRLETEDGERVCGLFLNTLPVRLDVSGGTWKQLIRQACDEELELLPVRRYPVSAIQANWGVEPLFETSFVYLNFHVIGDRLRRSTDMVLGTGEFVEETNFAIMTAFMHQPGRASRIALSLCTDRWIFTDQQSTEIAGYYMKTLEAMVADPSGRVDTFSPLSESELSQIVSDGTGKRRALMDRPLVLQQFAQHALRTPDLPCVEYERLSVSYGEVDRRSNQLANYLHLASAGSESQVAIGIDRAPELVVGLLGVLKAGASYVPMDPSAPRERLAFMIRDANISAVLTLDKWRSSFDGLDVTVVPLDSEWFRIALSPECSPRIEVDPRQLAYIIYTSGTTGRPKGVAIEHRQLAQYAIAAIERLQLPVHGRYGLISTFAADLGNTMIFPALCTGSCLRIFSDLQATDPVELAQQLADAPIDCLKVVPSHLNALLGDTSSRAVLPGSTLVLGGEAAEAQLIERLEAIAPECKIFNHYGPTETTVGVLAGRIENDGWGGAKKPPLGRPLSNTQAYVLDQSMEIVPVGTAGQLYIGGAGVSRGYWNNPSLTAERFIPDRLGREPGARLYRTGDLARWLAGGNLEFLGRIDNQVKIHGHRIELQEIEATMIEYPGVGKAMAVARNVFGEAQLAAYAVAAGKDPVDEKALRKFLSRKLPGHAVPGMIAVVPAFPLTANGKVDRDALARFDRGVREEETYVAPSTPVESELAKIWQDVLNVDRIGVHDSFFDMGGNSIKAILLTARTRKALRVHISVESVFQTGTISGMAQVAERALGEQTPLGKPIEAVDRAGELPLSFAQQRFWYAYQLDPENVAHNLPLGLRLRGPLDIAALERTLDEVVRRHEVLRSWFPSQDGEPKQVIAPHLRIAPRLKDLSRLTKDKREIEMRTVIRNEVWRPFDVERGPLLRTMLVRLAQDDHALVLTFHHIVFDGWSAGILLRELAELYKAYRNGEAPRLAEPILQYADFAHWERSRLTPELEHKQIAYWKEKLSGASTLEMPTDRPRPAIQSSEGAAEHLRFPEELTARLQERSQQEGVSLFMLLLAGYAALLQHKSKQRDIVIGCPIASYRDRSELQNVIGPFLNALALRIDFEDDATFRQLLGRVRRIALEAYAHHEIPFERLVGALGARRDVSRSPIFQVWFNHSEISQTANGYADLDVEGVDVGDTSTKFDLMLSTEVAKGRLVATLRYNTALFNADTASRLLQDLEALFECLAASPRTRIGETGIYLDELAAARAVKLANYGKLALQHQLRSTKRRAVSIHGE
jgi:amino acid adenylation domain-containing protein